MKSNGVFVKQNTGLVLNTIYDIDGLEDGLYEAYVTSVRDGVESVPSNIKGFEIGGIVEDDYSSYADISELLSSSNWEVPATRSSTGLSVQEATTPTNHIGSKYLVYEHQDEETPLGLLWSTVGAVTDIEIIYLSQTNNGTGDINLFLRAQDLDDPIHNCYVAQANKNINSLRIWKFVNGSFTVIIEISKSFSINTWYWLRVRIEGNTIKVKAWEYGTSEPVAWEGEETDSEFSSGYCGFYDTTPSSGRIRYVDYIAATTEQEEIPLPQ